MSTQTYLHRRTPLLRPTQRDSNGALSAQQPISVPTSRNELPTAGEKKQDKESIFKNIWLGVDCLNLFGINNVNSYYWITDVTSQQYAVPNYLTGRQINGHILFEF